MQEAYLQRVFWIAETNKSYSMRTTDPVAEHGTII